MAELVDKMYFQELAELPAEDVCRRALCQYDSEKETYSCVAWGEVFLVSPGERKIISPGSHSFHDYFELFLVHYLLRAKEMNLSNEWVSEKDIPGGAAFFRGPHELPTNLICQKFEDSVAQFCNRCEQLGGSPLDMADAAYSFSITPRVPVAVLYWRGDEDFPAESKLLFDRTIGEHLPLDIIYGLAVGVCTRMGADRTL